MQKLSLSRCPKRRLRWRYLPTSVLVFPVLLGTLGCRRITDEITQALDRYEMSKDPCYRPISSGSVVGSLRTLNLALETYSRTYGSGYSATLLKLQPPDAGAPPSAEAAGLVDSVLATGTKNRYSYIYTPGPPDATGKIATYTLVAVPENRVCLDRGYPSLFTDQTGVIRWAHTRPATAQDPPLTD